MIARFYKELSLSDVVFDDGFFCISVREISEFGNSDTGTPRILFVNVSKNGNRIVSEFRNSAPMEVGGNTTEC
jgi:hypothetical protein